MSGNFRYGADRIPYVPDTDVLAGAVVQFAAFTGIDLAGTKSGVQGVLETDGVRELLCPSAETFDQGAYLWWDPVTGLTDSPGALIPIGTAAKAKLNGEITAFVWLNHYLPANTTTVHNALTAVVADPGDEGAIAVTESGHVDLVTTTAEGETRDLPDPQDVGELLLLSLKTDGGDCVVTAASPINGTGNDTITLNDAGDSILLVGVAKGAGKVWRVVCNDGCDLTTAGD